MKKSFNNLFYLAVAGIICLSSCSTDEETPAPSINLVNPPAQTVSAQATVSFTVKVVAQEKIEQIIITEKIGTSTTTIHSKTSGFISNTEDLFVYDYIVLQSSGTVELSFAVTDKQGKVSASSFIITVDEEETPLAYEKIGAIIANKIGPDESAWDLAANVRRAGTSTEADLVNPSTADNSWVKGWNGVRSTTYVKSTTLDYADVTLEAATSAFASGTATAEVTNVAVDEVYIAKIKGGSHYAVLKITAADNNIVDSNAEKIEFTYKKVSENSGQ